MEYKPDFEELEPYYRAFWNCEVLDRIAVSATIVKPGAKIPQIQWSNPKIMAQEAPEKILDVFEESCENVFFGGLACPIFFPNFGPDAFSVFLGALLKFSDDSQETSWAEWSRVFKDYDDLSHLEIKENNVLYQRCLELTRQAIVRGREKFIVGVTDLHAGFDSLAVLRGGHDKAAMDLIENPEGVKAAMKKLFLAWKKVNDDFYRIAEKSQKGGSSWIGIWAPGKIYPVQNDFSCLVSPKMYKEFFLEELLDEISYLDYSIYHLDGIEALQHLDILLDIPELNAIQWVSGARHGEKGISEWFPLYKKIQARKKAIVVYPKPAEVPLVLEHLKPEGLLISPSCSTQEEFEYVMKLTGWGDRIGL